MDYRHLNMLSHGQHHPLPLIDDPVDRLTEAKYFSMVDLKSGYHQMKLRQEDAKKTAFVTPNGQYEWAGRGTPLGLSGAPANLSALDVGNARRPQLDSGTRVLYNIGRRHGQWAGFGRFTCLRSARGP